MPELVSRNTILVVDDAPINRELLTCIFEGYYDVITAPKAIGIDNEIILFIINFLGSSSSSFSDSAISCFNSFRFIT